MKPPLLLLLGAFGDNVLLILNPFKIQKVSPGAEQSRDVATAFQVLTTSSAVSPGVTPDAVFHEVRRNK